MLHVDVPFSTDNAGLTATTTRSEHILDMLIQFLLTELNERVNRPDFGTPLIQLCFEGNSLGLAELIQFIAKAGVQHWLADVIEIVDLTATAEESTLVVQLRYRIRGETEIKTDERRITNLRGII